MTLSAYFTPTQSCAPTDSVAVLCARVLGERGLYRENDSSNPRCPSAGWETSGGIQSSTRALLTAAANEDRVRVSLSKIMPELLCQYALTL